MRKTYYYLIMGVIVTLFFSVTANAATSQVSTQVYTADGNHYYNIRSYTLTNIPPTSLDYEDNNGQMMYYAVYELDLPIWATFTADQYYSGWFSINVATTTTSQGTLTFLGCEVIETTAEDGIHSYLGLTGTTNRVSIVFDNFMGTGSSVEMAHLKVRYGQYVIDPNAININASFTQTLTINNSNFMQYDTVQNNALTAMIYSAIYQGVGPDMQTIVNLLTGVRNQDYTYYNSIISGLSQLHTDNLANYNELLAILNEIDVDFAAVQTVLDLFPSYRTQVLQYWQELLQMNATQSSEAAERESEYAERESQSAQLISGMGSVNMPSISNSDLNILGTVDQDQKANFFGLIGLITHQPLVTKIMLIIVIGSIVGYILYGKKG